MTELEELKNLLHDHAIDDDARFKKIFDMLETLNTKTDSQTQILDAQRQILDEIRPYVQGIAGLGIVWKALMAVGGLLVIWVSIKGLFGFK